jgi:hypothetical protein
VFRAIESITAGGLGFTANHSLRILPAQVVYKSIHRPLAANVNARNTDSLLPRIRPRVYNLWYFAGHARPRRAFWLRNWLTLGGIAADPPEPAALTPHRIEATCIGPRPTMVDPEKYTGL